jgi:hypothetical protein
MKSEVTIADNRLRLVRTFNAPRALVFSSGPRPKALNAGPDAKKP